MNNFGLNPENPNVMWIDLNSAFATAEQQAHPSLRGRPVGVTNRVSRECCIIAASYEAKDLGVKVGMRRSEALLKCPDLILLETDPPKYHIVYEKLFSILKSYSPKVKMRSIDEGVIDFHGTTYQNQSKIEIGHQIKQRVRAEIGDYMKINVGIGPNRFLAKTAAGLHKPDGLDMIDSSNLLEIYSGLKLQDLNGIADRFAHRLQLNGINTPLEFLSASEDILRRQVFKGINGTHWYQRLRGYEVDDYSTNLGMVGRQWVVNNPTNDEQYLSSCLHYLAETVGTKLRSRGVEARGACVWLGYKMGGGFQAKHMFKTSVFSDQDIWNRIQQLFGSREHNLSVKIMGLYLYGLTPQRNGQISMIDSQNKMVQLTEATDKINDFYGMFTIHSADSLTGTKNIKQKIPFGGTEYFRLLLGRK